MHIAYDIVLDDTVIVYTGITSKTLNERTKIGYSAKMKVALKEFGIKHFKWVEIARFDSGDYNLDFFHAHKFESKEFVT